MNRFLKRRALRLTACGLVLTALVGAARPAQAAPLVASTAVGTLQSDPARANQMHEASISVATLELGWDRFEPTRGAYSASYRDEVRAKIAAFRSAGQQIVLDLGMQYPPAYVLQMPDARYVNQFGAAFTDASPGKNIANAVFNRVVRERQAAYVARVFADLGTNFRAVRLGWGWYSELNFPPNKWQNQPNCYWGFDALAQGQKAGLPDGVAPCPVPGWKPGDVSNAHQKAAQFANWYMGALQNYHDWQIVTTRRYFAGELSMLYPGWGIRPGQLDAAVAGDLSAQTQNINGELGQGVEYARFVRGITDPKVTPHTTWIDAQFGDDTVSDLSQWTPAHILAFLASTHQPPLAVSGENTGGADAAALARSIDKARYYHFSSLLWAWENQLFDGQHVSLAQLKTVIQTP